MKKLTIREEAIMQILWKQGKAFVKEIIAEMPDPKPHYNTVSTIVRILQDKGLVGHEAFGTTHRYYPILQKEDYRKDQLVELARNYFSNSYKDMVSFFARDDKLSREDLEEILRQIE